MGNPDAVRLPKAPPPADKATIGKLNDGFASAVPLTKVRLAAIGAM
jgi:hypothetical protein